MKKFFMVLIVTIASISIKAQHLAFMGVNMGQDLNSFCSLLQQKGLNNLYAGTNAYGDWKTFEGTFWEYDKTTILVRQSPDCSTVTEVIVYDIRTNQRDYDRLISNMSKKYGRYLLKPNDFYEKSCVWKTAKGNVTVNRTKYAKDDYKCGIEIIYADKVLVKRNSTNNKIKSKQHSNDL